MRTLLASLLLFAVCYPLQARATDLVSDPCQPTHHPGGPAIAGAARIWDADLDFAQATAQRRLEGWMAYFAADAVILGNQPVVGKQAIRTFYEKPFSDPSFQLSWAPASAQVFPSGDLGFTQGRYTLTRKDAGGKAIRRTGSYLTVWKTTQNGCWQIVYDTGSPDPPKP